MPKEAVTGLRKRVFGGSYPLDLLLLELGERHPSHSFLSNPSGQNVFLYLTEYVRRTSEAHFGRRFDGLRVLDWGCGKGHVAYLLGKKGGNVTCCDREVGSEDSSFGQEVPIMEVCGLGATPLSHDFLLPFQDGSFEVVLSFGVLEHVPRDAESLAEIHRVLGDDGLFFCFNLPYSMSWTQKLAHMRGDRYHSRLYSRRPLRNMVEEAGFEVMDIWHRQLFPKNSVRYPRYQWFERVDQFLTERTPLKFLATNIEFTARKGES